MDIGCFNSGRNVQKVRNDNGVLIIIQDERKNLYAGNEMGMRLLKDRPELEGSRGRVLQAKLGGSLCQFLPDAEESTLLTDSRKKYWSHKEPFVDECWEWVGNDEMRR